MLGEFERGEILEAQTQHGDAEAIAGRITHAFDEAELLQRMQQAEHRSARRTEAACEFGAGELALVAREMHQQLQTACEGGNGVAVFDDRVHALPPRSRRFTVAAASSGQAWPTAPRSIHGVRAAAATAWQAGGGVMVSALPLATVIGHCT